MGTLPKHHHAHLTIMSTAIQTAEVGDSFPFPKDYSFPAFFTRQPNLQTHHAQLEKWSALVLAYARHHRLFRLSPTHPVFHNEKLDRRFAEADVRELLEHMRKDGRVEWVGNEVFVYWRKPEDWARKLEKWVEDTAQKGHVLTLYEITEGEATLGTDFHGMDGEVLLKALNHLVKRGRAQIFGQDDSLGVKFF